MENSVQHSGYRFQQTFYRRKPAAFRAKQVRQIFQAAFLLMFTCCSIIACAPEKEPPLPIFGEREITGTDTVYHTIADFRFVDQDSVEITNETYKDKIYVTDFFFTSCRTICPIM